MTVRIYPSEAHGIASLPPSKSLAHRALLAAAFADGESLITRLSSPLSDDLLATIDAIRALGAEVSEDNGAIRVHPGKIHGIPRIPARASATTLRLSLPLSLLSGGADYLLAPELSARPIGGFREILAPHGDFSFAEENGVYAVRGRLSAGKFAVSGKVSSQYASGLLFALPLLSSDSEIVFSDPPESFPYLTMTKEVLSDFSVSLALSRTGARIPGGQKFRAREYAIPKDASAGVFFRILPGDARGDDLSDGRQGDAVYPALLSAIERNDAVIDLSNTPDLAPALFVYAALHGGARFSGTARLRYKESDRIAAMKEELAKCGIALSDEENAVTVSGRLKAPAAPLSSHNDHRVSMALATLLAHVGGTIEGAEAVGKSFPGFFGELQKCGVKLSVGL